jgi:glycosyltransferase involved in cell wall biosynthesis
MRNKLTIIIPAYNEEQSLKELMPQLLSFCESNNFRLIVVNDGSKDGTKNILESYIEYSFFKAVHHKVNRGYGGAIKSGVELAETDYLITIDADGQHDLRDVLRMYLHLEEKDADMVVGRRDSKGSGAYRSFGKMLIRILAKVLMPIHIHDINSGIKIYRTSLAKKYLPLCPDSMAYSDIITLAFISQRHMVFEIPVNILKRKSGKSTISTRTAFQTVLEIVNIIMLFNPLKVFLPLSILSITAGLAWGLQFMLASKGLSPGALLAFVVGVFFLLLGLIAEQLSYIRKNQLK